MCFLKNMLFGLFLFANTLSAQVIEGIGTVWNDSYTEWEIFSEEEGVVGEVRMKWPTQLNYREWDFTLGDELRGTIKRPWENDKSQWEIRSFGEIITCRTAWQNDLTEWKITDNDITLHLRTRFTNNYNEWELRNDNHGFFAIYTTWENDAREWTIIDELDEDISDTMKMALIFMVVYHSLPLN